MATEILNIEIKSNLGSLNKDIGNTSQLIRGVEGSVAGAQKAMDAFGVSSKTTNKSLEGVQTAMKFTDGIKQISNLSKVIKTNTLVTRIWNLVMKANPIALLVTVVTALIAGITALVFWMKKSSEQSKINTRLTKESTKALKKQTKAIDDNAKAFDRKQKQELAMAKASGESVEAIRELEIKLVDEKLAYIDSERAIANQTLAKERNTLATLKARGAEEDLIDEQFKNVEQAVNNFNTLNKAIGDTLIERTDLFNRHIVEREQAETDARNKRKEDRNQELEDIKKHDDDVAAQAQATIDRLADIRQKDDHARELQQLLRRQKSEIEAAKEIKDKVLRNKELSNLREIHFEEYLNLMDKQKTVIIDGSEVEKMSAEEVEDFKAELRMKAFNLIGAHLNASMDKIEGQYSKEKRLAQEKHDAILERETEAGRDTTKLTKKQKKELEKIDEKYEAKRLKIAKQQKAFKVAEALITTYQMANAAYLSGSSVPGPAGVVLGPIAAAVALAAGLANVRSIMAQDVGGGGGGGAGGGGLAQPPAPEMMSGAFQLEGGEEVEPTRAYVVSDDITNNQNKLAIIRRRATI